MNSINFTFGQVAAAFEYAHKIDPARQSAFRARLKHYQKQGWPAGINTGRGKAASYDSGHVVQLMFALQFNEMGLTPDRAVWVLDGNKYWWQLAFKYTTMSFVEGKRHPFFLTFDPSSLDELRIDGAYDGADETFNYFGTGTLREAIKDWSESGVIRFSVLNIQSALDPVLAVLSRFYPETDILQAMIVWVEDAIEEYYKDDDDSNS